MTESITPDNHSDTSAATVADLMDRLRKWTHRRYLARYREITGTDLPQWHDWRAIMAASFLDVSVEAERPGLIAIVEEEMEKARA